LKIESLLSSPNQPSDSFFFKTKDEQKSNTRQFLKHRYLHALAKLATTEGIELRSGAELFASAAFAYVLSSILTAVF